MVWTIRGQVSRAEAQLLTHSSPERALQLPLTEQQVNIIEIQIRKFSQTTMEIMKTVVVEPTAAMHIYPSIWEKIDNCDLFS